MSENSKTETPLNEEQKQEYTSKYIGLVMPQNFGRKVIYTDFDEITKDNLLDVLSKSLSTHFTNQRDINYLWEYYKGNQDILYRPTDDIGTANNTIVENHANEIVTFKTGYLLQNPIQYIPRGEGIEEKISQLNNYVFDEEKPSKDKKLSDWMHICGTGYRLIIPDRADNGDEDYAPFELYTLDPRNTFVVYHNGLGNKVLMGVTIKVLNEGIGNSIYSGYTPTHYFEVENNEIKRWERHILGEVPIIEYPLNEGRVGAFELVLPLLNAINKTISDKQNGLENFIHSLLVFQNVDLQDGDFAKVKVLGGISINDASPDRKADVKYLTQTLNQGDSQTLIDHQYKQLLRIVGMPFMSMSGAGDSSNGIAIELRDGWSQAEMQAKGVELEWRQSEKIFLRLLLRICKSRRKLDLNTNEIDFRFDRWNHSNILSKSQVLTTMLANEKIHPRLSFQASDMFIDPELAYQQSMDWYEEHKDEGGTDAGVRSLQYQTNRRDYIFEKASSRGKDREWQDSGSGTDTQSS